MNKRMIGILAFLSIGMGLLLLAGGWPRVIEGRGADDAGQTSSRGGNQRTKSQKSWTLLECTLEKERTQGVLLAFVLRFFASVKDSHIFPDAFTEPDDVERRSLHFGEGPD